MKTLKLRRICSTAAAAVALCCAQSAHAGLARAYLSSSGNDANACVLTAPCRFLPAALAAVNDGGEIWMLDSATYNVDNVNIAKSVNILAISGALGSLRANAVDAIDISTAGVKVTLRNINVMTANGGSATGIYMNQGASLTLENCEIYGMDSAIYVTAPNSKLTLMNTVIRDISGISAVGVTGQVTASLDNVHIVNSNYGLVLTDTAAGAPSVVVSRSVISNNSGVGVYLAGGNGTHPTSLTVADSVLHANATGIKGRVASGGSSVLASIRLLRNTISAHANAGIDVSYAAPTAFSTTMSVMLDGNAFIDDIPAIRSSGFAAISTRNNNTFNGSTGPIVGGTPAGYEATF
jgi:hypothetical protein